jgi:hypothetical protein
MEIVGIEKLCGEQIESIRREKDKFTETIMEEIILASKKIEDLQITIHTLNTKLDESDVQQRSHNSAAMNISNVSIEELKICLLSQGERQNESAVRMDQLASVTTQIQEEMSQFVSQADVMKTDDKTKEKFSNIHKKIDNMEEKVKSFIENQFNNDKKFSLVDESEIKQMQALQLNEIFDENQRKTDELRQRQAETTCYGTDLIDGEIKQISESAVRIQNDEFKADIKMKIQELSDLQTKSTAANN